MRDLLNRAGEMALLAIAAPFIAADAVRDVRRSGEDVAHLRGMLDRALGELGEARDTRESATRAHSSLVSRICKLDRKIGVKDAVLSGLADELKIAQRERDGYRADVAEITVQRDAAELRTLNLQRELDALRKPAELACEWCLVDVNYVSAIGICDACAHLDETSIQAIRARVAARLASCPTRRTSPDPLAVGCPFGCGVPAGAPCDPSRGVVDVGFGS
jgi:hypothetical protein